MWTRRAGHSADESAEVEEIPLLATTDKIVLPSSGTALLKDTDVLTSAIPVDDELDGSNDSSEYGLYPTEDEKSGPNKLRRVGGRISWPAYLIAFVELCERFSYNGTSAVFINFLQRPLPPGSPTGANLNGTPGALGLGTNASTGITTFNTFWVYVIPVFGAYIADTRLGRFDTVCWSVLIAMIGHILIIFSSLPSVMPNPTLALWIFIPALLIMGLGTGGFKSNISPLVAEQQKGPTHMTVIRDENGERVILDPSITTARIYMYFYLMINVGAGLGQLTMTFAEKYIGFWAAFTLPTLMFCLCPFVLWAGRNLYTKSPPQGSVLLDALRIWRRAISPCFTLNIREATRAFRDPMFWDKVKPSFYVRRHAGGRPSWMTFDDAFVDEVRRGVKACQVFVWYPLYWISFSQLNNNLTSQAATMTTNGLPNDVINNINPLALIILIPLCDNYFYPALRRRRINFSPLKRIFAGFMIASSAMLWAGVIQWYIYNTSPCGYYANGPACQPSPLNVWLQSGSYILIAISEIFASITGLEYAFTKAPKSMRSVVMSMYLITTAMASALGELLNPLAGDPLLIWNYAVAGGLSFVSGILFWISFRQLDRDDDQLNEIGYTPPNNNKIDEGEEDA